jgi:UDP-N-acetylglucosamine diphosphorylase/glucosamine-1-phosphate N-acetyltransferase
MNYAVFDDNRWNNLKPLTFTRPVAELRIGILTIKEKWEKALASSISHITQPYLSGKYKYHCNGDTIAINGGALPNKELLKAIFELSEGSALVKKGNIIAARGNSAFVREKINDAKAFIPIEYEGTVSEIFYPWDIFALNGQEINADFEVLTKGRQSAAIHSSNYTVCPEKIFVEDGARVFCSSLNASDGPIYIGRNSEVMENCSIRGGLALCEGSTLKMGAKIYGATTIGPHSKMGGEISNSVVQGFSNKAHDGYLGNSVIGEWCNLGADTNNSNLKNNYAEVKMWNYPQKRFIKTGTQFCGLIMGDHSKCAINTMFNTGTAVGVSANIFGSGFPRNFVPSFSWGGAAGFMTFTLPKAYEVAEKVLSRRKLILTNEDKSILEHVFNETEQFRNF